jgi:hypothetical protein
MKNGLSLGFSGLLLNFFSFYFSKNQNLNFLNCNQLIFCEPKKLVRTSFINFHKNRLIFVDIVIHAHVQNLHGDI